MNGMGCLARPTSSFSYVSSPERAREYLAKINKDLQNIEAALSHSVIGRDKLVQKINQIF